MAAHPPQRPAPDRAPTCHVVTHVHWDREWYRPFESFRARLVELAEHICAELDTGRMTAFHLDGQTIVLADIAALRPDLAERLTAHARAGRLTMGPWHVLADNQLVSGENLVRNLLAARRWGADASLATVGYSPDAFGHPADLPRILNGFGMDTALVWRGAPPGHARFRWRSPDGSEVFAVNQGYHAADVLWPADAEAEEDHRVTDFLTSEAERLPDGPWLLMNGGDHLAPAATTARVEAARRQGDPLGVTLRESTLEAFFEEARLAYAEDLPVITGELRAPGDHLTFLLPGTLSARTHLKQANSSAQTLLERWAEPLVALHAPHDRTLLAELRHAWELLLRNAPHDSLCGCSVDEVHRENAVRFDRVQEAGEHIVTRALAAAGVDTRLYGALPAHEAVLAVVNPHAAPHTGPVTVDLLTAPDAFPVRLLDEDGREIPFESTPQAAGIHFEADLDLPPDSRPARRHVLRFVARDVPSLGRACFTVHLGTAPHETSLPRTEDGAGTLDTGAGYQLSAAPDASLTLTLPDGTEVRGFGRIVDGGDRGDTYNYDPPAEDRLVSPRLQGVRRIDSPVRGTLELDATLDIPSALSPDREARGPERVDIPVRLSVTTWHDAAPGALHWDVSFDNTADDHRLRVHFPALDDTGVWLADGHFSLIERPVATDLGPLPDARGHEAVCASAPVQSLSSLGAGAGRIAVAAPGLSEVRAIRRDDDGTPELVLTLLRAVGWLSRFDLTSRTTGAGPMLPTPEAQCRGPQRFRFATTLGHQVADDHALVDFGAAFRVPLRAWQVRPGSAVGTFRDGPVVDGAVLTSLKPAEDGHGVILRVSNPTSEPSPVGVELPDGVAATTVRLDESATDTPATPHSSSRHLPAFGLLSLRLAPSDEEHPDPSSIPPTAI
ncbi:hypothetical protein [Streptomyces sp. NPDC002057]|uniref:glycoside hydrolase family 38 N-terminal domain-containing protein n=1 Tax=Streptomyces sp. NPDC002057 TaxID=3154664 RepID=UPI003320220D